MMRAYCLRMYEDPILHFKPKMNDFGISSDHIYRATSILDRSQGWLGYIKAIRIEARAEQLHEEAENWPGEFLGPLILQQQITTVRGVSDKDRLQSFSHSVPRRSSETCRLSDAEDEMVVNAATGALLQALLHLTPSVFEWVLNPVTFNPSFKHGKYTALTDGALRNEIVAILEVKKRSRAIKEKEIVIQETCQLVTKNKMQSDVIFPW
jgi:hypothetical protein